MSEIEDFLALRTCLLSPLPEHEAAAEMLSEAVSAILAANLDLARNLVRRADMPVLFEHTTLVMSGPAGIRFYDEIPALSFPRPGTGDVDATGTQAGRAGGPSPVQGSC